MPPASLVRYLQDGLPGRRGGAGTGRVDEALPSGPTSQDVPGQVIGHPHRPGEQRRHGLPGEWPGHVLPAGGRRGGQVVIDATFVPRRPPDAVRACAELAESPLPRQLDQELGDLSPAAVGAAKMLAVAVQDAGAATGQAADSPSFQPSRELLPPRRRVAGLAQAKAAPHPGAVSLQERRPKLAVDQVPGRQPHLVVERGRPPPPADLLVGGAGVAGQRGSTCGRCWPSTPGTTTGTGRTRDCSTNPR
jgi:hypothetical protein